MERWSVADALALDLIGYAGRLGASGKRPRFRFTTRQRRVVSYLPEIDAALSGAGVDPGWLHRKNRRPPFSGRSPLDLVRARGAEGMAEVLRFLNRAALHLALRA
jgi:hypothetical protein